MQFALYTTGHSIDNGKPQQRAACAVVLLAVEGQEVLRREIAWPLGAITGNRADLMAVYLALEAVRDQWRTKSITLHVRNTYPLELLKRDTAGEYIMTPRRNEQLVAQLRGLIVGFPTLQLLKGESTALQRVSDLARSAADEQRAVDSGTTMELVV